MRNIGNISIEPNRITTPSGQYPLNATSAVWVRLAPRNDVARWAIGGGALGLGILTGGWGLLFVGGPGVACITQETWQVVISTNGSEFVIRQFDGLIFMKKPQQQAEELKEAISAEIAEHPRQA